MLHKTIIHSLLEDALEPAHYFEERLSEGEESSIIYHSFLI